MVVNYNCWVMEDSVIISFQNWGYDNHVVFLCEMAQKLSGFPIDWFCKLNPWISFSGTHKKWRIPNFLQSYNINLFQCCYFNNFLNSFHNTKFLLLNRHSSFLNNLILYPSNFNNSRFSYLLFLWMYFIMFYLDIFIFQFLSCFRLKI
jgi:hypothetical protein